MNAGPYAIVGAGPAGISAAIEARSHGLTVLLLDENAAPGGRIWQALEARGAEDADEAAALRTLRAFRACGASSHWRATVWAIEPDGTVYWSADGATCSRARRVRSAGDRNDRAADADPRLDLARRDDGGAPRRIALKTAGLVPSINTWMAGQGPLLLLYAVQALRAGGRLAGVLDLSDRGALWPALRHLPRAARAIGDLRKGLGWRRQIARAGIPWIRASALRAEGDAALSRIRFRDGGGERSEPADLLLLHDGVIPSVQITRALGCAHAWDAAQRCWKPVTDSWGASSVANVLVAGDGAGVGGALAAMCSGRLVALGAAHALGRIDAATRDTAATKLRRVRTHGTWRWRRVAGCALCAPRPPKLDDATLVCRCEEVTAGQIREAARIGCARASNQLKAFTRCGMGPCQGPQCAAPPRGRGDGRRAQRDGRADRTRCAPGSRPSRSRSAKLARR